MNDDGPLLRRGAPQPGRFPKPLVADAGRSNWMAVVENGTVCVVDLVYAGLDAASLIDRGETPVEPSSGTCRSRDRRRLTVSSHGSSWMRVSMSCSTPLLLDVDLSSITALRNWCGRLVLTDDLPVGVGDVILAVRGPGRLVRDGHAPSPTTGAAGDLQVLLVRRLA